MVLAACGTDIQEPPTTEPPPADAVTWYRDAAPIVSAHCMSCHQAGGIAPFSLTDVDDAQNHAQDMLAQITAGTMPPFDAREEPDCTPRFGWKDDPRLSPAEISTLQAWVAGGTVAGEVAPVALPASTALGGVTATLAPTKSFTAAGDRDEFMCTILDPALVNGGWLTGMQVRPGNPAVVHHVVVGELPAGSDTDALIAAHGVGVPWDCSTTANPATFVMDIWTPGNDPFEAPTGMAVPITAGAKIVMQIHYHPAGVEQAPDTTSIDLRTTLAWPQRMYFVGAIGNAIDAPDLLPDPDDRIAGVPEFRIPANKPDHVETMTFTLADLGGATDVRVYSVNPHMHLLGTHIRGTITRAAPPSGEPTSECLANGLWNFDWQRTYIYNAALDELPTIAAGDTVAVQCHWDNTLDNPFEQRALADQGLGQPVDVGLGEGGSTDEMCLEIFGLSMPAPANPAAVVPYVKAPSWTRLGS
ncbi:MAG TPA: hypothetical protein VGF94_12805 [Kofleriaceae bacterium]